MNHANSIYADSIPANPTIIEQKKHDSDESISLHKMMSWVSHYPKASTFYVTEQASIFSMTTPLAHNNVPFVHTHSPLPERK